MGTVRAVMIPRPNAILIPDVVISRRRFAVWSCISSYDNGGVSECCSMLILKLADYISHWKKRV